VAWQEQQIAIEWTVSNPHKVFPDV
jgi:hypothetical protein